MRDAFAPRILLGHSPIFSFERSALRSDALKSEALPAALLGALRGLTRRLLGRFLTSAATLRFSFLGDFFCFLSHALAPFSFKQRCRSTSSLCHAQEDSLLKKFSAAVLQQRIASMSKRSLHSTMTNAASIRDADHGSNARGFMTLLGSSARFTARISASDSGSLKRARSARRTTPMPCSAEIDPPRPSAIS